MRLNHRHLFKIVFRGALIGLLAAVVSGLTLALVSCSNQEFGIFYFLENETEQEDYSLENNLTVMGMLESGGRYYIAGGGRMFSRSEGGDDWDGVDMPDGADYVVSLTPFEGQMYAGFLMNDETFRFYRAVPDLDPSWDEMITDSRVNGRQVIGAEEVNGRLFVITFDDGSYGLCSSDPGDGLTFDDINIAPQSDQIFNVTYDSDNAEYWAISSNAIYTDADGEGLFAEKSSGLPEKNGGYRAVHYSSARSAYYVSTKEGVVASAPGPAGDDWTYSVKQTVAGRDVPFGRIREGPENNILVATVGYGFFEMEDGQPDSLSRMSEFTAAELFRSWITDFYVNAPLVFSLTAGSGLWRNTYESGTWGDWIWE